MSLKSKLEAVIYAAEEPVTLAQLAGLFAEEALAWKAEQDAAAAAAREAERSAPTTLPMIDEGLEYLGLDQTPEFYAGQAVAEAQGVPAETQTTEAESVSEATDRRDATRRRVGSQTSCACP